MKEVWEEEMKLWGVGFDYRGWDLVVDQETTHKVQLWFFRGCCQCFALPLVQLIAWQEGVWLLLFPRSQGWFSFGRRCALWNMTHGICPIKQKPKSVWQVFSASRLIMTLINHCDKAIARVIRGN